MFFVGVSLEVDSTEVSEHFSGFADTAVEVERSAFGVAEGEDTVVADQVGQVPFVELRSDGAGTSQIDHVVVSRFGVFVIETKNLGGWIAGQEKEAQWTQKMGKQTRRIQNPLIQNRGHVKALREFLELDGSAFIPVVWMIGDARMKEPVPVGVLTSGLKGFLRGYQQERLDPVTVETAVARLGALEHRTDRKRAKREHVAAIQMRRAGV